MTGGWAHCSPALLRSGVDCADTPRRPCKCPADGSHDHFVGPVWIDSANDEAWGGQDPAN